ncbi:hypothetical protein NG799_01760 [Laspinema sp. D1]|uniref:RDRP core domain-containing protein n=1 Tax=Laspinema palackyanum D2a TaxID=2953684 RepID=A0ABT2MKQ0_9CYAN|nr:hypothetical protein [Laspinema sp. D2a]
MSPTDRFVLTYNLVSVIPSGDLEKIVSRTEMGVWNGKNKKWVEDGDKTSTAIALATETVYNNIILSALHPDHDFSVCAIPTNSTPEDEVVLDDYDNFSLDLAGGSRKHGHFLFTRKLSFPETVGQYYFPPEKANMGRINYGSICLSENKALFALKNARILVVPDPELQNNRPVPGAENPYNVGDAHGKIKTSLLDLLLEGIVDQQLIRERTPIQFRLGIPIEREKGIWGKGTVSPVDDLETDLVLPESCFKTFKPSVTGFTIIYDKVYIAALGEAQERQSRGGTQIWSWFPIDIIEQDIMPETRAECEKIVEAIASRDVYKVAQLFSPKRNNITVDEKDTELPNKWFDELMAIWAGGNPEDEIDDNAEVYMPALSLVLDYDQNRILERHPYVIDAVSRSLQKKWRRLAINGAVRMSSFMAQPDDSLGDMTFSCKHLEKVEHISYRYPVRHWGDIQLWDCVPSPNDEYNGVFFTSHVTFGGTGIDGKAPHGQGGDFDGDYGNAIKAEKLPNIAQRIRDWDDESSPHYRRRPSVIKAPKSPIQNTLKQVALRSMDNQTGAVASMIMYAQAKGLTEEIVPDGTGRTVLEVLSQALQDEVDRFKNDLARDTKALELVSQILTRGAKRPVWQSDYKSRAAYLSRPMEVGAPGTDDDTISFMIREVNQYWKEAEFPSPEKLGSNKFRYLFGINPISAGLVTQQQIDHAREGQREYNRRLTNVVRILSTDDSAIRKLLRDAKDQRMELQRRLFAAYDNQIAAEKLRSWAIAYWWVAHNERAGDTDDHPMGKAGLPFLLFPDIIAAQLASGQYKFVIYGIQKQDPPNYASYVPFSKPRDVVLIGTQKSLSRSTWILWPDAKGRAVYVNKAGDIALSRRSIGPNQFGYTNNDGFVYVFENTQVDVEYLNNNNQVVLDEPIGNRHFYLSPNGQILVKNQAPPTESPYEDNEGNRGLFRHLLVDVSIVYVDISGGNSPDNSPVFVRVQSQQTTSYQDKQGNIVLNGTLPESQYFYVSAEDQSIYISDERPHPRQKKQENKTDSIVIVTKGPDPKSYLNLGVVETKNITSIEVGQIIFAQIESYRKSDGTLSENSVEVTVQGKPRKSYVIYPALGDQNYMFADWDEQVTMWTEEFVTPSGTTRQIVFVQCGRTGNVPTPIGSLFLGCVAIPEGRQIQAYVRRIPKLHETIFSPL